MTVLTAKQKREAREQQLREEGRLQALEQLRSDTPTAESPIHQINADAMKNPGAVASATGKISRSEVAGAKVIVACKIGVPYIDLQLCEMVEVSEETQTGPRKRMQGRRSGNVVRIRGTAYPRGAMPSEFPAPPIMADGAALNYGIDKAWFDEWLDQNKRSSFVTNNLIFAHESEDRVRGQAREQAAILSGLEPINPKKDQRIKAFAKPTREEISDIETRPRKAGADA